VSAHGGDGIADCKKYREGQQQRGLSNRFASVNAVLDIAVLKKGNPQIR
jgi:hypothetical protein